MVIENINHRLQYVAMQSALMITNSRIDANHDHSEMDIINQLTGTLAFQLCNSDEIVMLVAGGLSHQTIRRVSAKIDGIAAYKGLDMIVDNCNQESDGMFQIARIIG